MSVQRVDGEDPRDLYAEAKTVVDALPGTPTGVLVTEAHLRAFAEQVRADNHLLSTLIAALIVGREEVRAFVPREVLARFNARHLTAGIKAQPDGVAIVVLVDGTPLVGTPNSKLN